MTFSAPCMNSLELLVKIAANMNTCTYIKNYHSLKPVILVVAAVCGAQFVTPSSKVSLSEQGGSPLQHTPSLALLIQLIPSSHSVVSSTALSLCFAARIH